MSHCRKNNWSETLENLIIQQINLELLACHTYNALHCFFMNDNIGFPGISNYFKESSDEEMEHARKFMKYQSVRGGTVKILSLEVPERITEKYSPKVLESILKSKATSTISPLKQVINFP